MKEPPLTSSFPEHKTSFSITGLTFGNNGPYDLSCSGHEIIGIRGLSGIGKTLFLRALADLDDHCGEVCLDAQNCSGFSAPAWRSKIALIPAESRWWYNDVKSHMGANANLDQLIRLLESLGFCSDVLDWQVSRLSTGEKQRLSVARALVRVPRVLLLDELGSSLDRQNCDLLEAVITDFQKEHGSPVLWVSHDQEQIDRICDRLLVLHKDRLEEMQLSQRSRG